jgi:site-specific DNA-methyltransferase (adenine-specific)
VIEPYYERSGITIFNADCRDVLPTLETFAANLILTDPPYERQAHAKMRRTRATIEGRCASAAMPFVQMDEELRTFFVRQSQRISAGWALAFCQAEAVGRYADLFGEDWRRPLVWIKPDSAPQFTGDRPAMGYESIAAAWTGNGSSSWLGRGTRGVFTYNCTGFEHEHPAQKPVPLLQHLIGLFGQDEGLVLDMFAGSGSTLVAAKAMNRPAIGIEKEERYCEIAARRLEQSVLHLGGVA